MATTCSNCNCTTSSCGCTTSSYTVVPPCPPACAEVFDASCIVYTGTDIVCGSDTVISRNDYLDSVVTKIINYVCAQATGEDTYGIMTITDTDSGYTWSSIGSAIATDPEDTFTVVSGVGINVDVDTTLLAMRITNTASKYVTFIGDTGTTSALTTTATLDIEGGTGITTVASTDKVTINNTANKYVTFKGTTGTTSPSVVDDEINFAGTTGVTCPVTADTVTVSVLRWAKFIADSGNVTSTGVADQLTVTGGTGITTAIVGSTLTITNSSLNTAVTLASAGGTSLVNAGTGPALVVKGLTAGSGITLSAAATDITIRADVLREHKTSVGYSNGAAAQTITHAIGEKFVCVTAFEGNLDVTKTTVITLVSTTQFTIASSASNVTDLVILG